MIEELQRSVIFFSRANATLKQQNEELTRMLAQAQTQVKAVCEEGKEVGEPVSSGLETKMEATDSKAQAEANAVAAQALYESQGFPAQAARAAAQTMNQSVSAHLPPMQPGATMQAMANFQQAAAAAMQAAMQGMSGIPGVNMAQFITPMAGANSQQAYTDTMTALAMSQTAGHLFMMPPAFIANPMMQQSLPQQPVTETKPDEKNLS
jgi:hypothetical protein